MLNTRMIAREAGNQVRNGEHRHASRWRFASRWSTHSRLHLSAWWSCQALGYEGCSDARLPHGNPEPTIVGSVLYHERGRWCGMELHAAPGI
jgi:hypothetical protein